ncbi:magnesium-translocating P-type ATPase [Rhizobium glycinendophyticum]|uniref:magnesium-translocating P-type ATPase n=1 Tax=Rhizobium glycinendophyticum TaxID=2589807 RepID=UPI001FE87B63|nr:magnesium-translocating P-type ATPase [Rhizobium glycinendophyticum]
MEETESRSEVAYWAERPETLFTALGSGPDGLTSAAAAMLLSTLGPNSVEESERHSALRLLLRQFESPLVLILAFAVAISLALQQWIDAAIVFAIVLGSSLLSFFQEYRASSAVAELKKQLTLTSSVMRDGAPVSVPTSGLVPGDVVLLSAGKLVPADGLVLEAQDFLVVEASMTGETFPVEKTAGLVAADAPLAKRSNSVFLGSSVRSGTARILITRTGRDTAFGEIAAQLSTREAETDFNRGVRRFGYLLIRVMVVIVLFVLTVNLLLGRPVIESLLFAVALAVGLSPELLPAIISVTLSAGARSMSRQGVIVRRLDAIENLGSMSVLCTDKTGTLTEGQIVMTGAVSPQGVSSDVVRQLAFLNAAFESGIENPLDAAIVAAGEAAGLTTGGYRKVDEIPYDFVRRRLTIVVEEQADPASHLLVTKGAFANVVDVCTGIATDKGEVPLDPASRAAIETMFQTESAKGFRVLALATKRVAAEPRHEREAEEGMVFAGLLLFSDPPKRDARDTLSQLAQLGVRVKVISGDNRYVTAHVAESVGLDPTSILTGEDLARLDDAALWHLAPRTDLFAEIDPQQKERIVRALQKLGECVGYMGDGINDAPSLHAADVGISVDGAVDVARESADVILLRQDLGVLIAGVRQGRRTFANTLKYISITTSANFGNMISMALAAPLLPFLPLLAKQILLNNFLSDFPSIAISSDNVDEEDLARPQHWSITEIQRFMIVFGLISSLFDLITFTVLLKIFHAGEQSFQTAWFVISLMTELLVVLVLRSRKPLGKTSPSGVLLWSTLAVTLVTLAIPYLGPAATPFGFVPLCGGEFLATLVIVGGYVAVTSLAKRLDYGHWHQAA